MAAGEDANHMSELLHGEHMGTTDLTGMATV